MITKPEIQSKQLLVITVEPGTESKIKLANGNLVYEKDGSIANKCSLSRLLHLLIIGDMSITTRLIRELGEHGISICLLKPNLAPYALFGFETQANFLLRSRQYELLPEQNLEIARAMITDKIYNQQKLLKRAQAKYDMLDAYLSSALLAIDPKALLGFEGGASKEFYRQFYEPFDWNRRVPRAKEDILNYCLDIGYTILFNCTDAICRHFGLDTYKGVYHTQFFARKSLVCDLMEPFRCLIDNRTRTALSLGLFKPDMFKTGNYGIYTEWKNSSKIAQTYANEIMEHRTDILSYVQDFYRHIMQQSNELPRFRLIR